MSNTVDKNAYEHYIPEAKVDEMIYYLDLN